VPIYDMRIYGRIGLTDLLMPRRRGVVYRNRWSRAGQSVVIKFCKAIRREVKRAF
jgi:hypothetical protein